MYETTRTGQEIAGVPGQAHRGVTEITGTNDTARPAGERVTETWIHAGARVLTGGKRACAWIDTGGHERIFAEKTTVYVIGAAYTVTVSRDGEKLTMHGNPVFARAAAATAAATARYEIADRTARIRLANAARERKAARQSALDEALEPLLDIAARIRNGDQMDALVIYVTRRLHTAYLRRS